MSWVRRETATETHRCDKPVEGTPDGLWRCDECGALWRLGLACDECDFWGGEHRSGLGQCMVGLRWRPARLGQRIRYWRKGRVSA